MTVVSPIQRNDYIGSGTTGPFAYGFRVFAAADLLVTKANPSGVLTTLTNIVDYTVAGVGEGGGGSITLTAALPDGYALAIQRAPTLAQTRSIRNQGAYNPAVVEDALDYLTMIDLAQQDAIDRSFKAPTTIPPSTIDTDIRSFLPGYYVRVRNDGSGLEGVTNVVAAQNFLQSGAGAVTRSANLKMGETVSVTDFGATGDGTTENFTAFTNANAMLAGTGTLFVPRGNYKLGTNLTFTCSLLFEAGAQITLASGVVLTITGKVTAGLSRIFNTAASNARVVLQPASVPFVVPQWWGAVGDGAADDTQPMQAMFDTAFGPASAPHGTNNGVNLKVYLPPGQYSVNAVKLYKVFGFTIEGAGRQTTTILNRADACAWDMNCVSYGEISGIQFLAGHATTNAALVELDGTFTDALKPQQITWRSCSFHGNNLAQRGYRFGLVGGSGAQGDTILFDNCLWVACKQAGADIRGFNALAHTFVGGNIQNCNKDGIAVFGGQAIVYGMSFQNQFENNRQVREKGADVNVYSAVSPSRLHDVRSESPVLCRGNAVVIDCEIYASAFFPWSAGGAYSNGDIIVGTAGVSTADGRAWRAIKADVTSYAPASNTGDKRHIRDLSASWTVNQWVGYAAIVRYPNGFAEGRIVASNTSNELVLVSDLTFDYVVGGVSYGEYRIGGVAGGSEPNWATASLNRYYMNANGSTTGGKMTSGSAALDLSAAEPVGPSVVGMGVIVSGAGVPDVNGNPTDLITTVSAYIDASHVTLAATAGATVNFVDVRIETLVSDGTIQWMLYEYDALDSVPQIQDTLVQFGRVTPSANRTAIRDCIFSRRDWLNSRVLWGGAAGDFRRGFEEDGNLAGYGSCFVTPYQNWSSSPGSPGLTSALSRSSRSTPVLFEGGDQNLPYNSVGIDRGDGVNATPGTTLDKDRNVVGVIGTLGKLLAAAANTVGLDQIIQAGFGRGTGGSGKIVFRVQPPGASGSTVPSGIDAAYFDQNGRFVRTVDGEPHIWVQGTGTTQAAGTTQFFTVGVAGGNATEANRQFVMPLTKTVSRLYLKTSSAQGAAGSLVLTVRKNGVDTALKITIAAGAAAAVFSDTTHSVDFAPGDLLSISSVNNDGTNVSAGFLNGTIVLS